MQILLDIMILVSKISLPNEEKCALFYSEIKKEFENSKKTQALKAVIDFAVAQIA
jgi:hypothetical protein